MNATTKTIWTPVHTFFKNGSSGKVYTNGEAKIYKGENVGLDSPWILFYNQTTYLHLPTLAAAKGKFAVVLLAEAR